MTAPLDPSIRLLSPTRRRIYPNARTGNYLPRAVDPISLEKGNYHPTHRQREGKVVGQPDDKTWDCLMALGWMPYFGLAEVDERGYVKCSPDGRAIGDPMLVPEQWPDPKRQGRASA